MVCSWRCSPPPSSRHVAQSQSRHTKCACRGPAPYGKAGYFRKGEPVFSDGDPGSRMAFASDLGGAVNLTPSSLAPRRTILHWYMTRSIRTTKLMRSSRLTPDEKGLSHPLAQFEPRTGRRHVADETGKGARAVIEVHDRGRHAGPARRKALLARLALERVGSSRAPFC